MVYLFGKVQFFITVKRIKKILSLNYNSLDLHMDCEKRDQTKVLGLVQDDIKQLYIELFMYSLCEIDKWSVLYKKKFAVLNNQL